MNNPESTWYFSGEKYDLFWSNINSDYGMVIITNPVEQNNDLTWVLTTVNLAVEEVIEIIQFGEIKPAGNYQDG